MAFSFDTTYKNLDSNLYSKVTPKSIDTPDVLFLDDELCADLGLDTAKLTTEVLAGQARTYWKNQSLKYMQATSMEVLPYLVTEER